MLTYYTTAQTLWELIYIQEVFPGRYGAAAHWFSDISARHLKPRVL